MFKGDEKTTSLGEVASQTPKGGRKGGKINDRFTKSNSYIEDELKMDSEQLSELLYGDVHLLVSQ